ncbi:protein TALPID3 isoform X3 [Scophthalmus maximus]|uniref:protein TALPID3 isoform X3 n=1 Tax=Scophthalmus maximus TaxID=52904 RepID=UPI001FA90372|nr:protein TALPID3 isoform X3 [Scophthalmus maximus]
MFRQSAHCSPSPRDPDRSSCSSDTGDVLIRSTRILLLDPDCRPGAGPGPVQITVQEQRPQPGQNPDTGAPPRAATDDQPDRRTGRTNESREASGSHPTAETSPDRKLYDRPPGHDLLTSRFSAGGRGIVLAALKQRCHSAPCRREVRVRLLDSGPLQTGYLGAPGPGSSFQHAAGVEGVQMEAGLSFGCLGDATYATAAAIAAAAPLIKAQSDVEAQVCRLADGVQKLLQADREGGERGRSLSQQTLQQLETLHGRQLQLQSQLLESALKIVTGHAPATSTASDLTTSDQPARLQVTDLDTAAHALGNQQPSSSATRAAAALATSPVSIATPSRDRPEQTRSDFCHQAAPSVTTATQPPDERHMPPSANHGQVVARKASEVLKEMERLKTEMKTLLTQPEDSLKTTRPPPDHHQSQDLRQNQQNQSRSQHSKSHQIQVQLPRSDQTQTQPNYFQYQQNQSRKTLSHQSLSQQTQQNQNQLQSKSVSVQRGPAVPSILEEAGQVLRRVRRQKKVLEENLEAQLRVKTGEVLHCQLDALAANGDWTEAVRIKKTVDAWISTLSKDVQAETSSEAPAGSSAPSGTGRPVKMLRETGSKMTAGRGGRGQRAEQRAVQGAEPGRVPGVLTDSEQMGESYQMHLYGRAPYEGLRRTLKKSPYLRLRSPAAPLSRRPRPRLVESIRGVKVKSCKTQTSLTPPLSPSPGRPQRPLIFSSSRMMSGDPGDLTVTPAVTYPVPIAILLGRRMVYSSSRLLAEPRQEVTSPPTPPYVFTAAAEVDGSDDRSSQREGQQDSVEAPPPCPPSHIVIEMKSNEGEEEENALPGTDFLSVADVVQEELSVLGEEAVELDGCPSPPAFQYQGPVFPPQAYSALLAQDKASVPDTGQRRDPLESRLVEWVEQQVMSRMILEMYPPPPCDPTQDVSTDQSESEEQSVTSDIVAAAGGGALQQFIDSNKCVDLALIRQLVNEVLTDIVASMLGQRDAPEQQPEPGLEPSEPAANQEDDPLPLVPTPIPTPPPSLTGSIAQTTPPTTPPPSEPTSLLNEECPQPIRAAELVTTPTPSLDPAPPTQSPPALHQAPSPLTWGDVELPLDEERPEEDEDPHHRQPLVMTVAEQDPPLSSPVPPPPLSLPSVPPLSPPPPPEPDSSPSSSSDDAVLKHVSEGEMLIRVNQQATMTEDDLVSVLSSSLQELQDMDYDPPSEGQVRGRNILQTLLNKMEQGERPQPEGSWGRQEEEEEEEEQSVGEVRDDWTTHPTTCSQSTEAWRGQTSSPGWISPSEAGQEEGGARRTDVRSSLGQSGGGGDDGGG